MEIELILKILLASALGGLIGLERELSGKEAGLRTNILIAIGSTLFTALSFKIVKLSGSGDPTRIIAQVVTGVGFIGAGSIIRSKISVHGLTTAATIWTVSAIGVVIGSGFYLTAFLVTILLVFILNIFKHVSGHIKNKIKLSSFSLTTKNKLSIVTNIKNIVMECGINHFEWSVKKVKSGYTIELSISSTDIKKKKFMEKIMEMDGISEFSSDSI